MGFMKVLSTNCCEIFAHGFVGGDNVAFDVGIEGDEADVAVNDCICVAAEEVS